MKTSEKTTPLPAVVLVKIIPAKRSEVFEAWTNPEILSKWFFAGKWTSAATKIDLRVGGRYEHEMISDGTGSGACAGGSPDDMSTCYPHYGEYVEIKPPEKLVFTWSSKSVPETTRVTLDFRDLGDKTELRLTHEFLPNEEQRKGHADGWEACLANLIARYRK